ncbi:uncharacterized protein VICG_01198 [Vittaforma corneae ATCC 50505]|uniref:Uncharacterized protein n=1 Tax=Vittaforma corneae (strain ATCC 50505) TaxID=993615 RepID=L2GLX1_VITCO|nr:uncharacterized protein VICG_01198 [Vittaforma corneae ATCC 50505]ELA41846.1 hypothetical protein VICG_01198 [Vittaforma corneae ATCC 50505]
MHGLTLPIKTVTGLIRVLSVGFPMLFSADASCTVMSKDPEPSSDDSLEEQFKGISVSDIESVNISSHSASNSRVFKDTDGYFTAFMEDSRIIKMIDEYLTNSDLTLHEDYSSTKAAIYEVVAMKLYYSCIQTEDEFLDDDGYLNEDEVLNKDGSFKEEVIQKVEEYLREFNLRTIAVSDFEFNYTPIKAWELLVDNCETTHLWISKAAIDVAALNSSGLSKLTMLTLKNVGLTEMPCLYNLTDLEYLFLNDNIIGYVNLQSYFDAKTGGSTMPKLVHLYLYGNPVSKIDARIKEVFTDKSMEIGLNGVGSFSIHGNMKDKLDKVRIQLVEPDEKKENESDVNN